MCGTIEWKGGIMLTDSVITTTDGTVKYIQATDILRYVWVSLSHDYDDVSILGVYATARAAMDKYAVGWKQEMGKDGTPCYVRVWGDPEWQHDVIVRYEVAL